MKNKIVFAYIFLLLLGCGKTTVEDKEYIQIDSSGNFISGDRTKYGVFTHYTPKTAYDSAILQKIELKFLPKSYSCNETPKIKIYPNPATRNEKVTIEITTKNSKLRNFITQSNNGRGIDDIVIPTQNYKGEFAPGLLVNGNRTNFDEDYTIYIVTEDSCMYETKWKMKYK